MQFAARPFSLTALPPSLRRLRLRLPSDSVRLFPCGNPRLGNFRPGVPAAPTEVLQVQQRALPSTLCNVRRCVCATFQHHWHPICRSCVEALKTPLLRVSGPDGSKFRPRSYSSYHHRAVQFLGQTPLKKLAAGSPAGLDEPRHLLVLADRVQAARLRRRALCDALSSNLCRHHPRPHAALQGRRLWR